MQSGDPSEPRPGAEFGPAAELRSESVGADPYAPGNYAEGNERPAETEYQPGGADTAGQFAATGGENDGVLDAADDSLEDTDPLGFPPIALIPEPAEDRRRGSRRRRAVAFSVPVFVVVLLVAAILVVSLRGSASHDRPSASPPGDAQPVGSSPATAPAGSPLTGPRQGLQTAVFALADGASDVRVSAAGLGGALYRISVPAGSGLAPRVEQQNGEVTLFLPSDGHPGPGTVDIVLNSGVQWSLQMNGGADESVIDMTGGNVRDVELAGGAARIDVTLPRPSGPVLVRMTGGVNRFTVHLAGSTPVRVQAMAGAGQVTIGGTTHQGIAPGRTFTANGWLDGGAGVDVQAVAGMAALSVLSK